MERHESAVTDLSRVAHETQPDRREGRSTRAPSIAARNSGSSPGNRGLIEAWEKDSANPGAFQTSDRLCHQLHAIRRRLWILSAALESMRAKIEPGYRRQSDGASEAARDRPSRALSAFGDEGREAHSEDFAGSWWARRQRNRLMARANRAERRAAAAMQLASASVAAALEAASQAAVARAKANEVRLSSSRAMSSQGRD
jgi:hypothetical protein